MAKKSFKILMDFDGVINSYKTGWHGWHIVQDAPVPGVLEWMAEAQAKGHKLSIYSMRTADAAYLERYDQEDGKTLYTLSRIRDEAITVVKKWLEVWSINKGVNLKVNEIGFPFGKPHFDVYIDDRGWRANGPDTLPSLDNLAAEVEPWFKRIREV